MSGNRISVNSAHAYPERRREASVLIGLGLACLLSSSPASASDAVWAVHTVEGEIGAEPARVCSVLRDLESFPRWFPGITQWRLLDPKQRDPASATVLVYGRQLGPGPYADRDYVVQYQWSALSQGGCQLEANAVAQADPAPEDSVVRIESMRTRWSVVAHEAGAHVRYSVEIAPGPIPEWVRPDRFKTAPEALIERLAEEVLANEKH